MAATQPDEGLVESVAWLLGGEARARIYIALQQSPGQTSAEVADATGLYPSTAREKLYAMHDDDQVTRQLRRANEPGHPPYEYAAVPPTDLVTERAGRIEDRLNAICHDERLDGQSPHRVRVEVEPTD